MTKQTRISVILAALALAATTALAETDAQKPSPPSKTCPAPGKGRAKTVPPFVGSSRSPAAVPLFRAEIPRPRRYDFFVSLGRA